MKFTQSCKQFIKDVKNHIKLGLWAAAILFPNCIWKFKVFYNLLNINRKEKTELEKSVHPFSQEKHTKACLQALQT